MSKGIEERLRHEKPSAVVSVYAGDVVEILDALQARVEAAEAEVQRLLESDIYQVRVAVAVGDKLVSVCGDEEGVMEAIKLLRLGAAAVKASQHQGEIEQPRGEAAKVVRHTYLERRLEDDRDALVVLCDRDDCQELASTTHGKFLVCRKHRDEFLAHGFM